MVEKKYKEFNLLDLNDKVWYSYEDYIQAKKFEAMEYAASLYRQWLPNISSEEEYDTFMTTLMAQYVVNEKDEARKTFNELVFRLLDGLFTKKIIMED